MKNGTQKIIFTILFIVLIMFSLSSSTIYAAINSSYGNSNYVVVDNNLDKKVNDNPVTGALASFVYSIASLVEKLVGDVFTSISGDSEFPWADRIIFNAVPLLDINFFNPADNSFFLRGNEDTPVAKMIRNTYFTILAITIAFLTIVVGIAAIRMALTTLATEKAKYKEAITKWMFSIILIFLMHNLMSFIFFLNEGLVSVASGILSSRLSDYDIDKINENLKGIVDDPTALKNFIEANKSNLGLSEEIEEFFNDELNTQIAYSLLRDENYQDTALAQAAKDSSHEFRNFCKNLFTGDGKQSLDIFISDINFVRSGSTEHTNSGYVGSLTIDDLRDLVKVQGNTWEDLKDYAGYQYYIDLISKVYTDSNGEKNSKKWANVIIKTYDRIIKNENNNEEELNEDASNLIYRMSQIFKEAAYTYPTDEEGVVTGWSPSQISVTGALLYAIFVFQSILYLFSYIKRFFYIVILAIFAPIIVLFDFLGKALS